MDSDVPFDDYITYPDEKRPHSRDHKCEQCGRGFKEPEDLRQHHQDTGHLFTSDRLPCLVPHCRRTAPRESKFEWICQKHWSQTDAGLRSIYFRAKLSNRTRLIRLVWNKLKKQAIERAVGI